MDGAASRPASVRRPSAGRVEEPGAVPRGRKRAGVVAAEQPVAGPRDETVAEIADRSRHDAGCPHQPPPAAQLAENPHDGVGLLKQALPRLAMMEHEVDGVEAPRIASVASKDRARERTLERREAETPGGIARENEPVETIAQPANAVVEDDRSSSGLRPLSHAGASGPRRRWARHPAQSIARAPARAAGPLLLTSPDPFRA